MMETSWFPEFLTAIERSGFGEWVRLTPHLYPILMSLHVVGIALLVGPAIAVDLRLLGVARNVVPVTVVTRYLLPISHVGFAIVALTGLTMFSGVALTVGMSSAAPWKLGLIILAGLNIVTFHGGIYRTVREWDLAAPTPIRAKTAAVVSASTWTGVVFAGRFLAY
ncbi:DUF6644 family protein [Pseudochrobactrum sp. B5]|uniref:DUF6644 family protein n=1 Tax=Pseudochrobactrum sp. B5 TaxID=1289478 RepID=UPI0009529A70|nr:DUF6644 family protein [Pseudochrobactrum sp. B5]